MYFPLWYGGMAQAGNLIVTWRLRSSMPRFFLDFQGQGFDTRATPLRPLYSFALHPPRVNDDHSYTITLINYLTRCFGPQNATTHHWRSFRLHKAHRAAVRPCKMQLAPYAQSSLPDLHSLLKRKRKVISCCTVANRHSSSLNSFAVQTSASAGRQT